MRVPLGEHTWLLPCHPSSSFVCCRCLIPCPVHSNHTRLFARSLAVFAGPEDARAALGAHYARLREEGTRLDGVSMRMAADSAHPATRAMPLGRLPPAKPRWGEGGGCWQMPSGRSGPARQR